MSNEASIEELIQRHQVCWEVWPLVDYDAAGTRTQVGFEVDLFGVHAGEAPQPSAEAAENVAVYEALARIAQRVLPDGLADIDCSVEAYDASIHATRKRRYREDVQLQILVRHKNDVTRVMDEGEAEGVRRIEEALRALGARKDAWHGG
jgi:hypothetical protein